jgi:hypothetical protein
MDQYLVSLSSLLEREGEKKQENERIMKANIRSSVICHFAERFRLPAFALVPSGKSREHSGRRKEKNFFFVGAFFPNPTGRL